MDTLTPTIKVTPKDFFLWLGAMVTLYASVISLLVLLFEYIDRAYPDPLLTYTDPYSGSIRFAIATLIVIFPLFLVLMRIIRKDIIAVPDKVHVWVRRWALYLTIFIAAVTLATDLVMLINSFLGGDLTMRFALKALLVFLVAGGGLLHFLADIRGYWTEHPNYAQRVGWAVGVLILASVVSGFFIIGSPLDQRLYKFDEQKINDLSSIQWQVINYWQQKIMIPTTLAELKDPIQGNTIPVDPETKAPYAYTKTGEFSFKLCATFNKESRSGGMGDYSYPSDRPMQVVEPDFIGADLVASPWNHGAGEVCFDRTIDPERYPVYKK